MNQLITWAAAWIDRHRLWLMGFAIIIGMIGFLLQRSGQYGVATHLISATVPLIIAVVIMVRAQRSSRLGLGVIAGVPLIASAIVNLFIEPANHPEVTIATVGTALLVFLVGFPVGLYSGRGISVPDR